MDERTSRGPYSFSTPARRQACDDDARWLDRGDKRVFGRFREERCRLDTQDTLNRERRVGEEPAGVALVLARVRLGPDERERRRERGREPRAQLEGSPVVLPAAEGNEDPGAPREIKRWSRDERDVGGRPLENRCEWIRKPVCVKSGRSIE